MIDWKRLFRKHKSQVQDSERRRVSRRRTKLRPGKIVTTGYAFVADCAIIDRSANGLRLRTFTPLDWDRDPLVVFDENDRVLWTGRIAWRRENEIGITLEGEPVPADEDTIRKLGDRYYAVGD